MGTLHHWFKGSKSKDGKPGWVQADRSPCANEPGETSTPKCFSSGRLKALKAKGKKGEALIKSAVRRKRQKDKEQQAKSGGEKPTNVSTFAKGEKDPNYVKAEPEIKEEMKLNEAVKDKPGKGSGKKDACYYKVKARYDVWPSAYACVPEHTTKALTRDSWKNVNELNIGDEILTYNIKNDELEFKPILNLHRYKNVKTNVIKSGNNGFIFECTENHKWVIKLPKIKKSKKEKYNRINDKSLIETTNLLQNKNNKHLIVSAPYNGGNKLKKDKIFKYEDNWIKYILDITSEQRQTWLFSAIVYDGNQKKVERLTENTNNIEKLDWLYTSSYNGKQSFGFKQKDILHRDAFLLSAFLNCGLVTWKKVKNKDIYSCNYISNKRFKNTSNFKLIGENITDVWCPETENGTWVMLQETDGNGIITITGNSGALVKCRKSGSKNWGTKMEEIEIIRYCPKCKKDEKRSECKYGPKYWDMFSLPPMLTTNQLKYDIAQVHPANESKEPDHEHSMARVEISKIISATKRLRKKLKGEGNIEAWVQSKITRAADYIDAAADYLDSGEHNVEEEKNPCWSGYTKKGMKKKGKKMVPNCVPEQKTFSQFMEDWQKVNRQDKTDGLSQKAVDAYRRENPGSKLQTAVTEKKPTGERAKRRKEFCSRMSGMKSKLTSTKTARDPNSKINKALRRWRCR